jgi:hypothetical protein
MSDRQLLAETCCPRAAVTKRAPPCETYQGLLSTRSGNSALHVGRGERGRSEHSDAAFRAYETGISCLDALCEQELPDGNESICTDVACEKRLGEHGDRLWIGLNASAAA